MALRQQNFRLPAPLQARLFARAKEAGVSVSEYLRSWLSVHFESIEKHERLARDVDRWRDAEAMRK